MPLRRATGAVRRLSSQDDGHGAALRAAVAGRDLMGQGRLHGRRRLASAEGPAAIRTGRWWAHTDSNREPKDYEGCTGRRATD